MMLKDFGRWLSKEECTCGRYSVEPHCLTMMTDDDWALFVDNDREHDVCSGAEGGGTLDHTCNCLITNTGLER